MDALHDIFIEPGVREFLWDGEIIPRSQTQEVLAENDRSFATRGFGLWGAREHHRDNLVGFCGFWFFRDPPERELLYGLSTTAWSRGLATEMASAMVDFGFATLGFDRIGASTDAPNTGSIRVLEKCGMHQTRRETIKGLDTVFFEITRP